MEGNILQKMTSGIDDSATVAVFITKRCAAAPCPPRPVLSAPVRVQSAGFVPHPALTGWSEHCTHRGATARRCGQGKPGSEPDRQLQDRVFVRLPAQGQAPRPGPSDAKPLRISPAVRRRVRASSEPLRSAGGVAGWRQLAQRPPLRAALQVPMEPRMMNPSKWKGAIGAALVRAP